jgi:hypothetical protein
MEGAAALDRERREHEAALEEVKFNREHAASKRRERSAAYSEFLTRAEGLRYLNIGSPSIETIGAAVHAFGRAEFQALLVAPEDVAKGILLLSSCARDLPRAAVGNPKDPITLRYRRFYGALLQLARKDLGIEGNLMTFLSPHDPPSGAEAEKAEDLP